MLNPLRYKETGYISPLPITTKSNKLTIKFTADHNNYGIIDDENHGKWEGKFIVTWATLIYIFLFRGYKGSFLSYYFLLFFLYLLYDLVLPLNAFD